MLFFADTANIDDLKELADLGLVDGATTNPSLIAKTGKDYLSLVKEILKTVPGPVSLEVTALSKKEMLEEAKRLADLADNVVIKLPITFEGLTACKELSTRGIKTNMTLCFSLQQALLVAKVGATYVSPFVGRLDDIAQDGMDLIEEIRTCYDNYEYETKILVASVRNIEHIKASALIGADAVTCPPEVLGKLCLHPLTDKGLQTFLDDWKKSGNKI